MKSAILKSIAFGALAALVPNSVSAAELVQTQNQTIDGQDFIFNFPVVSDPTGDGLLTLLIRGDFSGDFPGNESYDFDLEGVVSGTNLGLNTGTLIQSFDFNDNLFTQSFVLSLAQIMSLTNDNQINLSVNFAPGVSSTLSANPFIQASISYPSTAGAVPEPGTWLMMLLGFGFVGGALRFSRSNRTKVTFATA